MSAMVSRSVTFEAAHFLPDYPGKCSRMHGHTWKVEVAVTGEIQIATGMVIDFTLLKKFLEDKVVQKFDHRLLNDDMEIPTAENIASRIRRYWEDWAEDHKLGVRLQYIRVWESPDSFVAV